MCGTYGMMRCPFRKEPCSNDCMAFVRGETPEGVKVGLCAIAARAFDAIDGTMKGAGVWKTELTMRML